MERVRAKKALGQHFLTDEHTAARIADTVDVPGRDALPIVEVGPGMGMLTKYLMQKHRPLKAVEIDAESVAYLHAAYPELDVVEGDFLQMDVKALFPGPFALIGNYPYNISSQIFFKVLDCRQSIPVVSGMLQREVARRICAPEGSRERGILSVLLQAWYQCEYLFTVDEHQFAPPPKVKSGVIRLVRNDTQELGVDEARFKRVVKTAFGQRRKTLRNSLAPLLKPGSPLLSDPVMSLRPEALSVARFVELTRRLDEPG